MARTIDLTPSWAAAVEIYMAVLESPYADNLEGREAARSELRRLARAVDQCNAEPAPKARVHATGEPEHVIEHLGQVTDPASNDEESDSARWRAERRLERLEDRDELDLY